MLPRLAKTHYHNSYFPIPTVGFSLQEVSLQHMYKKAIISFSNNSCLDIYRRNSFTLNICAIFLSDVLAHLFNECIINSCIFQIYFKISRSYISLILRTSVGLRRRQPGKHFSSMQVIPVISKLYEPLLN